MTISISLHQASRRRRPQPWLNRDEEMLREHERARLAALLPKSHVLQTMVAMRHELAAVWGRSMATREQLVKQRTAHKNSLHALERKVVRSRVAEAAHHRLISELDKQIQSLEQEIERLFKQDPPAQHLLGLLLTIPGVGLLLAAQYLVLTHCGTRLTDPKALAAHLGIAPLPHESGKTVWRPARSRHFGPAGMRKLLHLAARSVCTHKEPYRLYYHRKLCEGKPKRLVLNNVANKLLKVMTAVVQSRQPYDPNYAS
jgi:transposase